MALGFVAGQGDQWEIREFTTTSTATFLKGCPVALSGAGLLIEYASTNSHLLGFALQDSVNSLPAGKVQVAIPKPGCTAWTDMWAGIGTSNLSAGMTLGLGKSGNYSSIATTLATSVFSRVIASTGRYDSARSRVEVYFVQNEALFYSTSSVTIS